MSELLALSLTAISISSIHTMSGPDHYLPFIVLSRSGKWSPFKTYMLTTVCGLGHILSSVILGLIAVVLGWQLNKISWFQDLRGNVSSGALLIFGLAYLFYGLWQAFRNKPHKHFDVLGGTVYVFEHKHGETVMPQKRIRVTPLVLFAIFFMGPSEPLIPLLFFSGTQRSIIEITVLIAVFAISTILTMLTMVMLGRYGYEFIKTETMERYSNAFGGLAITICAIGMLFFGW
jgi:sulfite exporter TauE/SafE